MVQPVVNHGAALAGPGRVIGDADRVGVLVVDIAQVQHAIAVGAARRQ